MNELAKNIVQTYKNACYELPSKRLFDEALPFFKDTAMNVIQKMLQDCLNVAKPGSQITIRLRDDSRNLMIQLTTEEEIDAEDVWENNGCVELPDDLCNYGLAIPVTDEIQEAIFADKDLTQKDANTSYNTEMKACIITFRLPG